MNKLLFGYLTFMILLIVSCSQQNPSVPKPRVYPRVDRTDTLLLRVMENFQFEYSSDADLVLMPTDKGNQVWFNLEYPQFNAVLYCSYTTMRNADLSGLLSDNRRFIYSNTRTNTRVEELDYTNQNEHKQGSLYYFDGNPISPYQFYLTDSVSYFLRGSLYYTQAVQTDSILPTSLSLKEDIINLMESFQNK